MHRIDSSKSSMAVCKDQCCTQMNVTMVFAIKEQITSAMQAGIQHIQHLKPRR